MKYTPVLACFLVASPTQAVEAVPYGHDADSVVRLECGTAVGTGVKLTNGLFITAAHVSATGPCKANGEEVKIVYQDRGQDFTVFESKAPGMAAYTCKGFKAGKTYLARGYAHGWSFDRQEPWIATKVMIDGKTAFVGTGEPGMSGGPVFNERGEVVGIVNMRWPMRSLALKDTPLCRK